MCNRIKVNNANERNAIVNWSEKQRYCLSAERNIWQISICCIDQRFHPSAETLLVSLSVSWTRLRRLLLAPIYEERDVIFGTGQVYRIAQKRSVNMPEWDVTILINTGTFILLGRDKFICVFPFTSKYMNISVLLNY